MTDLDKYIQMLSSPKAGLRYDACERLRISKESSVEAVLALLITCEDTDKEVAERAEKALAADIHQEILQRMDRKTPKMQDAARRLQEEFESANIVVVSTPAIEGKQISEYFGIVSGESLLEIQLVSEIQAGKIGWFTPVVELFPEKLEKCRNDAINELRKKAVRLGANAILGVNFVYFYFGNLYLMVAVHGTAVIIKDNS